MRAVITNSSTESLYLPFVIPGRNNRLTKIHGMHRYDNGICILSSADFSVLPHRKNDRES